jgi:hypothetical protein
MTPVYYCLGTLTILCRFWLAHRKSNVVPVYYYRNNKHIHEEKIWHFFCHPFLVANQCF